MARLAASRPLVLSLSSSSFSSYSALLNKHSSARRLAISSRSTTAINNNVFFFALPRTASFSHSARLRNMEVQLSAPNGQKWSQPIGLFINNEFVKSSNDQKIASINPAYVSLTLAWPYMSIGHITQDS